MSGTNYEVPHCEASSNPHSRPSWTWAYYRSKKGEKAREEMVTGRGTGYGKNWDMTLETEGRGKID